MTLLIASRSTIRGFGPFAAKMMFYQLAADPGHAELADELLQGNVAVLLDYLVGEGHQVGDGLADQPRLDVDALAEERIIAVSRIEAK